MIAGITYRGKEGEAYSPFNHFISELGETGISGSAWAFNIGLMISGVSLILGSLSLGLILPGVMAKLGMAAGIISSVGLFFVGVFPMNKIKPHTTAAMAYFRGGLSMVIFFTLAIALQPEGALGLPRAYSFAGLPAILSFGGFLFMIQRAVKKSDDNMLSTKDVKRPNIWPIAILEWSIYVTIVLWFVIQSIGFC
ncbi:MAG: DUF998 domain-containing protein [Brevefilum sp.]|nr:DUF998 domain-containing protein [Brevefilum sp.]